MSFSRKLVLAAAISAFSRPLLASDFSSLQQRVGSICGVKFNDQNGNGVRDPGEPTLAGWTMNLGGIGNASIVTDREGRYCFNKLPQGDYVVSETQQAGWTQTAPAGGSYTFNLAAGQNRTNVDFGNVMRDARPGRICGVKFNDLNGNGVRDNGEPGLGDWTIQLGGATDATTVTDKTGNFCFGPLKQGQYKVGEVQKGGWTQTAPASEYYVITLGPSVTNLAFGNRQKSDDGGRVGSICGVKFNDLNGNGVRDNGEPTLSGWTINLGGVGNGTVVTDKEGKYCFNKLPQGDYMVTETQQAGWTQTAPVGGSQMFNLGAGQNRFIDFGNHRKTDDGGRVGSICGVKFNDLNGNGVRDNGEPTLSGWTINLGGIGNGAVVTDKEGKYCFNKLPQGDYMVTETQQNGWTQTAPAGGSYNFNLGAGVNRPNVDFGNTQRVPPRPARICGVKFNDLNGNGVRDNGEPGLGDWTILLGGAAELTTTTDKEGNFCFLALKPGTYKVGEAQQDGWTQTAPASGSYNITLGASVTNLAFGNQRRDKNLGAICGVKFNDLNGNGVRDAGEPGLPGWQIVISGTPNQTVVTDAEGKYCVYNLRLGDYAVTEVNQYGWIQTAPGSSQLYGYNFALVAGQVRNGINFGNRQQGNNPQACLESSKQWMPLGPGVNGEVWAMTTIGNDLYVGGSFTAAGSTTANHIAKWNGTSWSSLGSGANNGLNGGVFALAAIGTDLYAAGWFTSAGTTPALNIAKWNGSSWSALGAGLTGSGAVEAMTVLNGQLYVGGAFWTAGTTPANKVAKWDPSTSTWSALGSGMDDRVNVLTSLGSNVYAGGQFNTAGGVQAYKIAKWNGSNWSAIGAGFDQRVGGGIGVMNNMLYPGGEFNLADGNLASKVAKLDPSTSTYMNLGTGMNNGVEGFASIGSDLYVSGSFTTAGGSPAFRVAKWNGSTWSPLGSGMNDGTWRLAVIGNDLYAGGIFTQAGGNGANHVAKWGCPGP